MSDTILPENISTTSSDFLFQQELYVGLGDVQFNVRKRFDAIEKAVAEIPGDPGAGGSGVQEVYVFDHVPTPDELVFVPENMLVVYGVTETEPPEYCDICGEELIDGRCPNNHDGDGYDNGSYGYDNGYDDGYNPNLPIRNFRCTERGDTWLNFAWDVDSSFDLSHFESYLMLYHPAEWNGEDWGSEMMTSSDYTEMSVIGLNSGTTYTFKLEMSRYSSLPIIETGTITVTTLEPAERCDICGAVLVNGKCPNNHTGPGGNDNGTTEGGDDPYYGNDNYGYYY